MACCLLALLFDPEDGGSMFFQNIGKLLAAYIATHPRSILYTVLIHIHQKVVKHDYS
jgi:hypothetical protein